MLAKMPGGDLLKNFLLECSEGDTVGMFDTGESMARSPGLFLEIGESTLLDKFR